MPRIFFVHTDRNEVGYFFLDNAIRAIFSHKVQTGNPNARIHLTSRNVTNRYAERAAADFFE
jgi:hypothetical protein